MEKRLVCQERSIDECYFVSGFLKNSGNVERPERLPVVDLRTCSPGREDVLRHPGRDQQCAFHNDVTSLKYIRIGEGDKRGAGVMP
jgi:hypothetical protein